jgi:calcineurin-like phosphoesterase family protein
MIGEWDIPVIEVTDPENSFAVADFHFDHTNIITYCERPFASTDSMNAHLLRQYHRVVKEDSLVFLLGDIAFGERKDAPIGESRNSRSPAWWITQLGGKKIYVIGSHDKGVHPDVEMDGNVLLIAYGAIAVIGDLHLFMVHNPIHIPLGWNGIVVHGHYHNKHASVPFAEQERRRVNVSVDVLPDWEPMRLSVIARRFS